MVQMILQSVRRLALKIASYGLMHLVVAILVAFAITRDWRLALAVGCVEPVVQTFAYTLHDRIWHRIENRRTLTPIEESVEAVGARLDVMNADEQRRSLPRPVHTHHRHSHALPKHLGRVALKTVTYGVMHLSVAVSVAYVLTRDIRIALAIGTIEPLVQTVFFTIHDRFWTRIEARRARRTAALA